MPVKLTLKSKSEVKDESQTFKAKYQKWKQERALAWKNFLEKADKRKKGKK